jgi:hypothetical protein
LEDKLPLKIKIFLWYLQRGVILTKDDLAKRNWRDSKQCCFCNCDEIINHLLFNCHHAKEIWRIVYLATGLTPPKMATNMLGVWLYNLDQENMMLILVEVVVLC